VVLQGLAPSTSPDAGPVIDAAAEPGAPLMLPSDPPQNTQE
jgi:hypothetical protein